MSMSNGDPQKSPENDAPNAEFQVDLEKLAGEEIPDDFPTLAAVLLVKEGERYVALWQNRRLGVELGQGVHPVVVAGAVARKERLLVGREGERLIIFGALRTQPTPGIDEAEEYKIQADRIHLEAGHEVRLKTEAAKLVLRARGYVETVADRITTRAETVHRIVGRMLHLN